MTARRDIIIPVGADYIDSFTYRDDNGTPVDFFGFTAKMQIRTDYGYPDVLLELTTASPAYIILGANGLISFNVPGAVTADMIGGTFAKYDLLLTDTGPSSLDRLTQGKVYFDPRITV